MSIIGQICAENAWEVSFNKKKQSESSSIDLFESLSGVHGTVIYSMTASGVVTDVGGGCYNIFGQPSSKVVGSHFALNVPRHERERAIRSVELFLVEKRRITICVDTLAFNVP